MGAYSCANGVLPLRNGLGRACSRRCSPCDKAAREGVVFKNIEALELTGSLNTVVMDKTGTVTVGKPFVTDVLPIGISAEELMILAASLEEHSAHPIASAVLDYANKNEIYPVPCEDFRSEAGRGMSARVEGETVKLASVGEIFTGEYEGYAALSKPLTDEGKAVVALSRAGVPIGVIGFADKLKPTSRSAIEKLNAMGVRTIMLTGDTPEAAKKVASELSFYDCAAGVSPDKKADIVNKFEIQFTKGRNGSATAPTTLPLLPLRMSEWQ